MEQDSRNHRVAEFGIVPDVEELSNLTGRAYRSPSIVFTVYDAAVLLLGIVGVGKNTASFNATAMAVVRSGTTRDLKT